MGYTCCLCNAFLESIAGLCAHIRLLHPKNYLTSYRCCHCPKEYGTLQYLRDHLNKKHPNVIVENVNLEINHANLDEGQGENDPVENDIIFNELEAEEANVMPVINAFGVKRALYESALSLSAKLYSNISINRCQIQEIINITSDFLGSGFLDLVKSKSIELLMANNCPDNDVEELKNIFSAMQSPFLGLKTESQRLKALKLSNSFVSPQPFHIAVGEVSKRVNGVLVRTPVDLTGQYLPIRHVLKNFLELPGVLNATLENVEKLRNSQKFTNVVQSTHWRAIEQTHFQGRMVLPLVLYYDDAEPDNQTGAHSGAHSLGLVYYQIPCIPQHLLSLLEFIFVAMVFLTDDHNKGNARTFRKLINDLKDLENNGLHIQVDGQVRHIFFALFSVIGDNKAVNSLCNLVGSFTANYFCRFCREHRNITRNQLRENANMLRNIENYNIDILTNDQSLTGIKGDCVWNELNSFHVTTNIAVDIMHDMFEGVCHYDLTAMLSELIRQGYFTLATLNERIQFFDFGYDVGNKMTLISADHLNREKLKMSASEMFFFVRHLGLIIGDLIPEYTEEWGLYTLLAEIIDIITAPFVNPQASAYLANLIAEHHEVYMNVSGKTLKPKHHFMVHYPGLLSRFGPLIHLWCMRFEGMHRPVVKRSARSHTSRKNLPYTTAVRYSLSQSFRFLAKSPFPADVQFLEQPSNIRNDNDYDEFRLILPNVYYDSQCYKQIKVKGTLYKRGMVLPYKFQNESPVFGKIHCIVPPLLGNDVAWFLLSGLHTEGFSQHLHCYEVTPASDWFFVSYHQLLSFYPSECRIGGDGLVYVTYRHVL